MCVPQTGKNKQKKMHLRKLGLFCFSKTGMGQISPQGVNSLVLDERGKNEIKREKEPKK